jgi:hypothetical protein
LIQTEQMRILLYETQAKQLELLAKIEAGTKEIK